jgi:hypothetical protein
MDSRSSNRWWERGWSGLRCQVLGLRKNKTNQLLRDSYHSSSSMAALTWPWNFHVRQLPRPDRMAKGKESGSGCISLYSSFPKRRNLRINLTNAPRSRVNPQQHCRGKRSAFPQGPRPLPVSSPRIVTGVGNATFDSTRSRIYRTANIRTPDIGDRRTRPNSERPDQSFPSLNKRGLILPFLTPET